MSETLINNMLKIKGLQYGIRNKIVERAGGNPFFIEEVVRSFIDEGAVIVKDGVFEVTEKIETMVIPHTINDVLMARIDRLEDETRNLVKVASVIGRNFFHKILSEVAKSIEGIDKKLSYLKEIQLIRERKRMEELEYLFKHALAQEAAYESILQQKRKELHLNVADSIEKIFKERLHEFYGILSYHYISGDDLNKAEKYMLKAGEEAMKSSASNEALHYYQKAMMLYINKHEDAIDYKKLANMEENIAYAFLNKGFYLEAVDYFDKSLMHRGEKINKKLIFIIPKLIINIFSILISLYLPSIRSKKIPTEVDEQIMQRAGKIATSLAMVDATRCFVENSAVFKKALENDISKSQAYFNMITGGSSLFALSGISLQLNRKILDYSWKSIDGKSMNLLLHAYRLSENVYNYHLGDWRGEIDDGAVNDALGIGDFTFATGQLLYLGYMKIELGNFEDCEIIIKKLHKIYDEYNFEHAEADVYVLKTKLSMKKKGIYDAQNYVEKAIIQSNKTKWYGRVVECFGTKARIEIFHGNLDSAWETIQEAEKLIRQVGKEALFIGWYCDYLMGIFLYNLSKLESAILMDKQNDIRQFRKATLKSGKITLSYTKYKYAIERTESFKLMGKYYWLIGKQKKAFKWWGKAVTKGEKLGARPDLSRTYFEIGKALLDPKCKYKGWKGLSAQEYLNKARTMFQEIDLQYDLDELDKIAAST